MAMESIIVHTREIVSRPQEPSLKGTLLKRENQETVSCETQQTVVYSVRWFKITKALATVRFCYLHKNDSLFSPSFKQFTKLSMLVSKSSIACVFLSVPWPYIPLTTISCSVKIPGPKWWHSSGLILPNTWKVCLQRNRWNMMKLKHHPTSQWHLNHHWAKHGKTKKPDTEKQCVWDQPRLNSFLKSSSWWFCVFWCFLCFETCR